jgi:hypothetical protein
MEVVGAAVNDIDPCEVDYTSPLVIEGSAREAQRAAGANLNRLGFATVARTIPADAFVRGLPPELLPSSLGDLFVGVTSLIDQPEAEFSDRSVRGVGTSVPCEFHDAHLRKLYLYLGR